MIRSCVIAAVNVERLLLPFLLAKIDDAPGTVRRSALPRIANERSWFERIEDRSGIGRDDHRLFYEKLGCGSEFVRDGELF